MSVDGLWGFFIGAGVAAFIVSTLLYRANSRDHTELMKLNGRDFLDAYSEHQALRDWRSTVARRIGHASTFLFVCATVVALINVLT